MICIEDNGTCGLGGFCRQCPNLKGESMTDKATVKDLELWAKESKSPLVSEGYLMAARTIRELELKVAISPTEIYLLMDKGLGVRPELLMMKDFNSHISFRMSKSFKGVRHYNQIDIVHPAINNNHNEQFNYQVVGGIESLQRQINKEAKINK